MATIRMLLVTYAPVVTEILAIRRAEGLRFGQALTILGLRRSFKC